MKYLGRTDCHFCRGKIAPIIPLVHPLFGRFVAQCRDCKAQYLILHFRDRDSDLVFLNSGSSQPYASDLPRYRVVRMPDGSVLRHPSPTCTACSNYVDYHDYCWSCHRYNLVCSYCYRTLGDVACACDTLDNCA